MPYHNNWATLQRHLPTIAAKSVLLTYMSADMLGRPVEGAEAAEDGSLILF